MMNLIQKYKNYIVLIVIAFLGYIVYSMFFSPDEEQQKLLESTKSKDVDVLGEEIIRAINQIQNLTLDESVLNDPVLNSLIDLSEPIELEPFGRNNPFEPFEEGIVGSESSEDGIEIPTETEDTTDSGDVGETEPEL